MLTPEEVEDAKRSWEAYGAVQEILCSGEYTNGDVLFVIGVLVGEIVRDEAFDFEEVFQDIRDVALSTIKASADS